MNNDNALSSPYHISSKMNGIRTSLTTKNNNKLSIRKSLTSYYDKPFLVKSMNQENEEKHDELIKSGTINYKIFKCLLNKTKDSYGVLAKNTLDNMDTPTRSISDNSKNLENKSLDLSNKQ